MEIRNPTPLAAGLVILFDVEAAEHLYLAVRGVWDIAVNGTLKLAAKQPPLSPIDEHYGEPGKSSVRYEADIGPAKLATDVALVGSAIAFKPGATAMEVALRVGPVAQRALVQGERTWSGGLFGQRLGDPAPFDRIPLIWELAAGGTDTSAEDERHHALDQRNPLGRGFRAKKSRLAKNAIAVPQIEAFGGPADQPLGFGFIGPHWLPRQRFAGTYDQAWQEERCPLLPTDFDPRFFNSAAPGLTAPGYLQGGEQVEVRGCTVAGDLSFALPTARPTAAATIASGTASAVEPIRLELNTVVIDTERMQVRMLWRGDLPIHRRLPNLRHIAIDLPGAKP